MHGDYENKPQFPDLQRLAAESVDQGDGMPCRMLVLFDGVVMCYIQERYGHDAKPQVCRDYPEFECHQETKTFKGRGECMQVAG